jgi:hypothetical protein
MLRRFGFVDKPEPQSRLRRIAPFPSSTDNRRPIPYALTTRLA